MPSPPTTEMLNVEYDQQINEIYCGPASALMVLHELNPALPYSQDDIFREIQSYNSASEMSEGWHSGPFGLWVTVNALNPRRDSIYFALYVEDDSDILTRKIVWTIHHYKVAPIVLVFSYIHWIVVTGFETTKVPANIDDTSYYLNAFYINNPANDGMGINIVYYGDWFGNYMIPVSSVISPHWAGKFIAICDPEPPPKKAGKILPIEKFFDGKKIIDKGTAKEYAVKGLNDHGTMNNYFLQEIMKNVVPDEPVLVECLDKGNDYYYIVPMRAQDGGIRSLVRIDARYGNIREAGFVRDIAEPLNFKPLTREEILKLLRDKIELKKENKIIFVYEQAISIYPLMVWQPCLESLTPYKPFHMVTIGKERIYIRLDGQIFHKLTVNVLGV